MRRRALQQPQLEVKPVTVDIRGGTRGLRCAGLGGGRSFHRAARGSSRTMAGSRRLGLCRFIRLVRGPGSAYPRPKLRVASTTFVGTVSEPFARPHLGGDTWAWNNDP